MSKKLALEFYVRSILNDQDSDPRIKFISEMYSTWFIVMIQNLKICESTIMQGLEIMAEELLQGEQKDSHVLVFLVFCIEFNKHCIMKQYKWYKLEMLVEIIVNILFRSDFIPPSASLSFNICAII